MHVRPKSLEATHKKVYPSAQSITPEIKQNKIQYPETDLAQDALSKIINNLKESIINLLPVDSDNKEKLEQTFDTLLTTFKIDSTYDVIVTLKLMRIYIANFLSKASIAAPTPHDNSKQIQMLVNDSEIVFQSLKNSNLVCGIDQLDNIDINDVSNEITIKNTPVRKKIDTHDILLISFMLATQMLDDCAYQLKDFADIRAHLIYQNNKIKIDKPIAKLNKLTMFFCEAINFDLNPSYEKFYANPSNNMSNANTRLSSSAKTQKKLTEQLSTIENPVFVDKAVYIEMKQDSPASITDNSGSSEEISIRSRSGHNTSSSSEEATPITPPKHLPRVPSQQCLTDFFNATNKKETSTISITVENLSPEPNSATKPISSLRRIAPHQHLNDFFKLKDYNDQSDKIINPAHHSKREEKSCTLL